MVNITAKKSQSIITPRDQKTATPIDCPTILRENAAMDTFIVQPMFQLGVLLITLLSSYYLIKGVMELYPAEVARISSAHLDYNAKAGESFAKQKADTVIGFSLLLLSSLVQWWSISSPLRWVDVDGLRATQTLVTLTVFALIILVSEFVRRRLVSKYTEALFKELSPEPTPEPDSTERSRV